jgi:hypothetical protein
MTQYQVFVAFLLGYLMVSAGLVWRFDEYGLMGAGAGLVGALFVVNVKE